MSTIVIVHQEDALIDPRGNNIVLIVFPLAAFSAVLGSILYFRIKMNSLAGKKKLSVKLIEYRTALIVRWSIIEATCYLLIVAYLLSRLTLMLAIIAFLQIYFLLQKAGPLHAIANMQLGPEDQKKISNPDQIVINHYDI